MKDRNTLLHDLEISLSRMIDPELLETVLSTIYDVVEHYEVQERCTDIVPVDTENEQLLKKYAACLYIEGRSYKTISQYLYRLKDFYDKIHVNFKDVGSYDIRRYLAILKQRGNSNSTLDGVRQYLSAFYKWMTVEGEVTKNPCDSLKPIKFNPAERIPFSDIELEKIRNNCLDVRERAIVETLVFTGVRVSELADLNIEDIDLETKSVYVKHGKGDKGRFTYINAVAAYYLRQYLSTRNDSDPALFISKYGRLHTGGVRFILKEIESRCGVHDIYPHRFRHTFATELNKSGMPIQHIQKLLGHSKIDTTMIYVTVDQDQVKYEYNQYMRA